MARTRSAGVFPKAQPAAPRMARRRRIGHGSGLSAAWRPISSAHWRRARGGLAAIAGVAEGSAGQWDAVLRIRDGTSPGTRISTETAAFGARRAVARVDWRRLSARLAAAGSQPRLRMLAKLLEGPGTYRALQRLTGLKVGPLYHHINALRLAGLLGPKQRDLYELTRAGRNLILILAAADGLMSDARRRPLLATPARRARRPGGAR